MTRGQCDARPAHTHCASVHQAAKLVATLLRVAGVTAGLSESNGSLPPGLCLTSRAGSLPRTGISSGTLRSVIEYGLPLSFLYYYKLLWSMAHLTCNVVLPEILLLTYIPCQLQGITDLGFMWTTCWLFYLKAERPQVEPATFWVQLSWPGAVYETEQRCLGQPTSEQRVHVSK